MKGLDWVALITISAGMRGGHRMNQNNITDTLFATALVATAIYITAWSATTVVNEEYCASHGAQYAYTDITLTGWCRVQGVVVRAEGLSMEDTE